MDIYNFDYELRHIIPQYVEIIEVQMKSLFSYEFTRLHGPLGYLNDVQAKIPQSFNITIDRLSLRSNIMRLQVGNDLAGGYGMVFI
jgi:hypothetical protein